ncbi:binding protein [Actinidia rufa]|uniref:Binding protein n=1 Tax=Actinidia rufa TaxID=165716 RepID=A0A7J0G9B5_9ERIC|nr:binding protein [Actinidia rufa]
MAPLHPVTCHVRVLQSCGLVGYRKVLAADCTMGKWPLAQADAKAHEHYCPFVQSSLGSSVDSVDTCLHSTRASPHARCMWPRLKLPPWCLTAYAAPSAFLSPLGRSEGISSSSAGASRGHPLLAPCLNGIGKFAHLIDLDFMGDLINYLRKLAGGGSNSDGSSEKFWKQLTVAERLRCCIVAFKVMRNNLDALNIDLQDFFVQLYSIILEYKPGRDQGEILAEALKIMLCDDRQHDMQRSAAFIKRLATFSLCFGSAESMAAMVTVKHLLQKNVKCRNLLENDAGGGSVSGPIAKYQPYASDPNLSAALASVLWELNLLSKHYHPAVSTLASSISTMHTAQNQVYHSNVSPQQAFTESSLERESFNLKTDTGKQNHKRRRSGSSMLDNNSMNTDITRETDEDMVRKKLSEHFLVVHDISETKRLRSELDQTASSLRLYELYKMQKKLKKGASKPKKMIKM